MGNRISKVENFPNIGTALSLSNQAIKFSNFWQLLLATSATTSGNRFSGGILVILLQPWLIF